MKEMKCKLRNEQHEREQEQTHHVAMLRELQHMLGNLVDFMIMEGRYNRIRIRIVKF